MEEEQLSWHENGQLWTKEFYKEGNKEGPPGTNGVAESNAFKV